MKAKLSLSDVITVAQATGIGKKLVKRIGNEYHVSGNNPIITLSYEEALRYAIQDNLELLCIFGWSEWKNNQFIEHIGLPIFAKIEIAMATGIDKQIMRVNRIGYDTPDLPEGVKLKCVVEANISCLFQRGYEFAYVVFGEDLNQHLRSDYDMAIGVALMENLCSVNWLNTY